MENGKYSKVTGSKQERISLEGECYAVLVSEEVFMLCPDGDWRLVREFQIGNGFTCYLSLVTALLYP